MNPSLFLDLKVYYSMEIWGLWRFHTLWRLILNICKNARLTAHIFFLLWWKQMTLMFLHIFAFYMAAKQVFSTWQAIEFTHPFDSLLNDTLYWKEFVLFLDKISLALLLMFSECIIVASVRVHLVTYLTLYCWTNRNC